MFSPNQLPLVSVIIPTYNYAGYIAEALKSIQNQQYPTDKIEIIVVDDGSTDNTKALIESYELAQNIRYFFQENSGKASATRKGINEAKGEIIFNMDADDFFFDTKIAKVVHVFEQYPEVVHVGHPATIMYNSDNKQYLENIACIDFNTPIDGKQLMFSFLAKNILYGGGSTFACRKKILDSKYLLNEVDMYTDEYLLYATLLKGKSYFIQESLSVWRIHQNNYSVGILSKEMLLFKRRRLLNSAKGLMTAMQPMLTDTTLETLLRIKYFTRLLYYYQEENNTINWLLNLMKMMAFMSNHFFIISGNWKQIIKNYTLVNRFLPPFIYKIFKKYQTAK